MGYQIEVSGGRHVSPEAWAEAAGAMGCRVEFQPNMGPCIAGEPWIRFAHPAVADGIDLLLCVSVDVFHPARDAPVELLALRRSELEQLRELNAPWSMVDHLTIVVGWLTDGRQGVAGALEALLAERRAAGFEEDWLEELRGWVAHWQRPDAELQQSVLLRRVGFTRATFLAEQALALAYGEAAGGRVPSLPDLRCDARAVPALLSKLAEWEDSLFEDGVPAELPFPGWDNLPDDEVVSA